MSKKISKIEGNLITFENEKGEEVNGTNDDCKLVGGIFNGTNCILPRQDFKPDLINLRTNLGQNNDVNELALNNTMFGYNHKIDNVINTHTIGKFAHTTRHGEFNHAFTTAKGRSQRSVLMFEGRTTDATETEIYLGGDSGKRFIVDETKECVIVIETYVLAKRVDSRDDACMGKYQHATFRVTLGALTRIGINNKTNHNDGISGWTNDLVAVSSTPDYIKATVTGQASCTIDWTIIAMVSELKTDLL